MGHVEAPWLHVHFAERRAGVYRNPLRPGALTPWHDTTKPRVTRVVLARNGRELAPQVVFGAVDVIAEAHQMPPLPFPPPWNGLPSRPPESAGVSAAASATVRPWHTPIDFRKALLPQRRVRADLRARDAAEPSGRPGLYRFLLAHTWSTTLLPDGHYRLEVEAFDLCGNTGSSTLRSRSSTTCRTVEPFGWV